MRIYRNEYKVDGESGGFAFFTNSRDAKRAASEFRRENDDENEPECIEDSRDVPLTRDGLMEVLHAWAAHPDNG
jgi:hypothetical protein